MRRVSLLSSLAGSLVVLTLGAAAAAAPSLVTKSGPFQAPGVFVGGAPGEAALVAAAKAVLADQIEASRPLSFGQARVIALGTGDRVVKLPQVHMGLAVAHRGASVIWREGAARLVTSRLESSLPDDVTPSISLDQAGAVAEGRTGLPVSEGQSALVLWPTPDGVKLAWAMGAEPLVGIPYQPVAIVDAKSGEILYVYNAIVDLNVSQVYASNPVKSPQLVDVTLPVGAGQSTLDNELVQSLNCIDKKTVKDINFMGFALQAHVCDLLQTAVPDANGDYMVPPGADTDPEDAFAEVSMFYHVNRAYTMFRGWDPALDVNNGPIPTVSNLRLPQGFDTFDLNKIKDPELPLVPFQNAFFSPANPIFSTVFGLNGGAMWFGQGPLKDYSYDGDVVYHEFTHAVVNVTLKLAGTAHMDEYGASMSPGAMNEGLADYFSSALTGDGDVGEYASKDFAPGSVAIRSLTNPDACPTAVGGEVHQDATMFSGSLWDVRTTLAEGDQLKFDAAIFAAMNAGPTGELGYEDFATLAIDQVKTSLGDAAAAQLTDAFTKRGLLPQCTRVLEYTDGTLKGPKELQNLWFAPGTSTTGVKTTTDGKWTPGVVQMHMAVPADTTKLEVEIRSVAISAGGLGMGGTAFTPKFLFRFGADPITFKYGPLTADGVIAVDGTKNGSKYLATIDVPAGTTEVFVMIGSTGSNDGAFTDFIATPTTGTIGTGGAGGAGGAGGSTGTTTASGGAGGDDTAVEGGCGCSLPGKDDNIPEGAALAALAALGLIAARRVGTKSPSGGRARRRR